MSETECMRVLLVDDQVFFRSGLKTELSAHPQFEVVGEAKNGYEAISVCRENRPDVVLLDLSLPRWNGLFTLERIKAEMPKVKVLVLTIHDDDQCLLEALKKGANGYLLKSLEPKELIEAIERVDRGEAVINGKLAARILDELRTPNSGNEQAAGLKVGLSSRELSLMEYIARGDTNAEIAHTFVISENTVKMHLAKIMDKLHLQNRTQVAVYAVSRGLVDILE